MSTLQNMVMGHIGLHISPPITIAKPAPAPIKVLHFKRCTITSSSDANSKSKSTIWSNNLISLAVAVALVTPLPSSAIPSFNSQSSSNTPFSQARNMPTGLENGKIRACPSINPSCVSSNPKSSNFAFPWRITGYSSDSVAIQELQDALMKTQKNVKIQPIEDTPKGKYLKAEVDVGFGRDVLEFVVNGDVVSFRAMATKVAYVYPFTTAFGDSRGEEDALRKIVNELGWYAPSFDSMD